VRSGRGVAIAVVLMGALWVFAQWFDASSRHHATPDLHVSSEPARPAPSRTQYPQIDPKSLAGSEPKVQLQWPEPRTPIVVPHAVTRDIVPVIAGGGDSGTVDLHRKPLHPSKPSIVSQVRTVGVVLGLLAAAGVLAGVMFCFGARRFSRG
jgi:hypothetical protein